MEQGRIHLNSVNKAQVTQLTEHELCDSESVQLKSDAEQSQHPSANLCSVCLGGSAAMEMMKSLPVSGRSDFF